MRTVGFMGSRIVRKPAGPGYGVELSGGSLAEVMQVRATPRRSIDAAEICLLRAARHISIVLISVSFS
jgi:hypothetical protein